MVHSGSGGVVPALAPSLPTGGREVQGPESTSRGGGSPIVVILALGSPVQSVRDEVQRYHDAEVHVVASPDDLPAMDVATLGAFPWAAVNTAQLNWCLRMIGAPHTILDISPGTKQDHKATWNRAFLHLSAAGVYRVPRNAFSSVSEYEDWVDFVLSVYAASRARKVSGGRLSPRDLSLAGYAGGVAATEDMTELTKTQSHLLKVRDDEASRLLATRLKDHYVRELVTIPSVDFQVRGKTFNHGNEGAIAGVEATFQLPARRVRAYEGPRVRVVERCLAVVGDVVVPESFRFHLEQTLRNPRLVDTDSEFSQVTADWNYGWERLPGTYYHLDASNSGHFGHLMTEVISKLWGWDAAISEYPDLKAIFRIRKPQERYPKLELDLFTAYGIPEDRIVWVGNPVCVDRLVAATPLWHNQFPHYADPMMLQVWDRLASRLVSGDEAKSERLFISRPPTLGNRSCRNVQEVEAFFEEAGFDIVYPEKLSLEGQASLFAHAKVIAGFGGSALFNVGYCRRLEKLIVLNHEAYTARNEHLYGSLLGCEVHYFWSKPDTPHPVGGWSEDAYFSSWECDLPRLRAELLDVIR